MRKSLFRDTALILVVLLPCNAKASWLSDITGVDINVPANTIIFCPPRPDAIPAKLKNLPKELEVFFLNRAGSALAHAIFAADKALTTDQAKNHIGEKATVCGVVVSTHYASTSRGNPTFVNLDKPYPNRVFTILIWGSDLAKFNPKPSAWDGKRVCATGVITSYRGSPEIVAKSPHQITIGK